MASLKPPTLAYLSWAAVCLIWGTTYLAILIALETIPPTLLGGLRFVVAGLFLCLFICSAACAFHDCASGRGRQRSAR